MKVVIAAYQPTLETAERVDSELRVSPLEFLKCLAELINAVL